MTKKDKKIIHQILNWIGSNTKIQDELALEVGKVFFDMTENEFDTWLSKIEVK